MPRDLEDALVQQIQIVTSLLARLSTLDIKRPRQAKKLVDIKKELRILQASLATADLSDRQFLAEWCSKKSTAARLGNIDSIISHLETSAVAKNSYTPVTKKGGPLWKSPKTVLIPVEVNIEELFEAFYDGENYSVSDRKILGLSQLQETETEKKLKQLQIAGEHFSFVVGEVGPPVGKMIKEGVSATHASVVGNTVANTGTGLSGVAMAIPIVGASVIALMLIYEVSKGALQARGFSDRMQRVLIALLGVASIVLTAIFLAQAAIIGALMVPVGVYAYYVKPYLDLRAQEKELGQQLKDLEIREKQIANRLQDYELNESEKQELKKQVTLQFSEDDNMTLQSLQEAKALIDKGNINELKEHPIIGSIDTFLLTNNRLLKSELNTQLSEVIEKRKIKRIQSINGIFTIIGAALIPIPIPPVMFLGITIVVISSLVGVILTYKEPIGRALTRMKNRVLDFFRKSHREREEDELEALSKNNNIRMTVFRPLMNETTAAAKSVVDADKKEPVKTTSLTSGKKEESEEVNNSPEERDDPPHP